MIKNTKNNPARGMSRGRFLDAGMSRNLVMPTS
jgi:hypothetical protein